MISTWTSFGAGLRTAFAAVGPFVLVVTHGRSGPAAWWRTAEGELVARALVRLA